MQKVCRLLIRLAKAAALTVAIILVTFAVILSDGRALDLRIGLSREEPVIFMMSAACWLTILWVAYMLTAGGWRNHFDLKRALLTGLLIVPMVLILVQLEGPRTPKWIIPALVGVAALFAALIAERIIPRVDRSD